MELNVSIFIGGVLKGAKKIVTPCVIGRSKEAGLTVAHPAMSRKHCELFEDGGKLYLRDNSSLNGTLFHAEYIEEPVALAFGDEFTVGELTFRVTAQESVTPEQRQAIAEQPTAAIELDDELGLAPPSDDQPGMATVLEAPPKPKIPEPQPTKPGPAIGPPPPAQQKAEAPKSKGSKKVAAKDVRIDIK